MARSPISLLVDNSGNIVGIVSDGGVYRLQTQTKLRNPGNTADMGDVTTPVRVDPTGTTTQPVSAASLPLPTGAATEATLATLATETKLEAVRVLLASLDGKDYATQTTLASLEGKDFATQTTLATLATEAKLEAVRVLLASLDGKDFATETTLASADSKLGTIDADTGQLVTDLQELLTRFGDDVASPAADTLLARIQEMIDNIGSGASPVADTLQARVQELIDSLGDAVPSPVADTVQARLQEVIDLLATIDADTSNLDVALSTRATEATLSAADTKLGTIDADTGQLVLDLQELLIRFGDDVASPAADTLLARIQELIDNIGSGITPVADTLQARIQELIDSLGNAVPSPIADTVQARLQEIIDLLTTIDSDTSNLDVALSTRATESTLDAIRDNIGEGIASPTADTLMARVQEMIDLLTSIKDSDGIQIIDDIIRLGDLDRNGINSVVNNLIRRLEARSSITSPDGSSDVSVTTNNSINRLENRTSVTSPDGTTDVAVITDNSINRLETRGTIVGQVAGSGAETKVTIIQDTQSVNEKRLQTEARIAPGSIVNIGTSVPSDPSDLVLGFLTESGGDESLLVDGSTTSVDFTFGPSGSDVWSLQDVLIVFTADDFEFNGASFGPNAALANGVVIELVQNSVVVDIFTIKQNEDFLRVPGRLPLVNNTGPKDVLSAALSFGGLVKLSGATGDVVRATVRDNLTNVKLKYFTLTGYATKD